MFRAIAEGSNSSRRFLPLVKLERSCAMRSHKALRDEPLPLFAAAPKPGIEGRCGAAEVRGRTAADWSRR